MRALKISNVSLHDPVSDLMTRLAFCCTVRDREKSGGNSFWTHTQGSNRGKDSPSTYLATLSEAEGFVCRERTRSIRQSFKNKKKDTGRRCHDGYENDSKLWLERSNRIENSQKLGSRVQMYGDIEDESTSEVRKLFAGWQEESFVLMDLAIAAAV